MMYYLLSMGFCFSQAAAATVEEVVPFGEAPPGGVELDAAPSSNAELRRFDDLLRRVDDYEFSNRINGGRDAEEGEVPFHVSLRSKVVPDRHFCSGSLIAERWVLTAGQCLHHANHEVVVRIGGRDYAVKRQIGHPQRNTHTRRNDIGLIELAKPASGHMTIQLAQKDQVKDGMSVLTSGLGKDLYEGQYWKNLQVLDDMKVIPLIDCASEYSKQHPRPNVPPKVQMDGTMMCAKPDGIWSCQEDWGAPLYKKVDGKFIQMGITSWGLGCNNDVPGVYTFVPTYTSWIKDYVTLPHAGCRKYVDRNAVKYRAGRAQDHPTTVTAEECEARCVEDANCYLYTWVYVGWSHSFIGFPPHMPIHGSWEWNFRCVLWSKAKAEKEGRASPESFVPEIESTTGVCETEPTETTRYSWNSSTGMLGWTSTSSNGLSYRNGRPESAVHGIVPAPWNRRDDTHSGLVVTSPEFCKPISIELELVGGKSLASSVGGPGYMGVVLVCDGKVVSHVERKEATNELKKRTMTIPQGTLGSCRLEVRDQKIGAWGWIGIQNVKVESLPCGVSTEYEYAGCFKSRWDRSKTRDVPTTAAGVEQCRDLCKAAGFKYFGFECPHRGSKGTEVHCECGQTLNEKERIDDAKCREFNKASGKHCTGPFTVEGYSLGAGSLNSAYRV